MSDAATGLRTALHDRYRIEHELGQGGMATVYLAEDLRHGRRVAIKVLRPDLAAVIGAERFLREIRTIATLQHPHILGLIDSGEVEGTAYYVMPYVDGESLRDRLDRETQLPVADAVRIATEVAGALDYAHRHGVIHRDIKPENLLLHDGSALVADFGIALAVSQAGGGTRMTETGMSLGTPQYMSPEQAMGEREIGPRSDIYALGATLYEMLAGEAPFTGPTAQAIVAKVMTADAPSISVARRSVPPHVEAAVMKALEKLPADRFGTAAEFAEALTKPEVMAAAIAERTPVRHTPAGGRPLVIGLAAALLIATGAAVWGWLAHRRAADAPATWQYITFGDSAHLNVNPRAPALDMALSPDGNTLVFRDERTNGLLWAKHRGQLEPTPIPGTEGATSPVFSPDGQWIAFEAGGHLKKMALTGAGAITLADTIAGAYGGDAWLDDGRLVYVDPSLTQLRAVNAAGGPSAVLLADSSLVGGGTGFPVALPQSRGVLFQYCASACVTVSIHVLDLRTGRQKLLIENAVQASYLPMGYLMYARTDGVVLAAPFDLKSLTITGQAVPILDHVDVSQVNGYAPLVWSPSGTLVYARGGAAGAEITVVRVDRSGVATPIDSTWSGSFNSLALSPNGRLLAVGAGANGGFDVWIKQLDRGPFTRLTFSSRDRRPEWSPDGRTVAFVRDSGNNSMVFARAVDGSGSDRLMARLDRPIQEVFWTHDGQWLIVRTDNATAGAGDILGIRTSGDTTPVPLAATRFSELEPAVSPDGRWLAYASNESGIMEIYVRPFPNAAAGRWQVSNGGGTEPVWSSDGRELFYSNADARVIAAQVAPGASFHVNELRPLFDGSRFIWDGFHRSYAVSPDGTSFYFLSQHGGVVGTAGTQLVWVDHWFRDVEQRLRHR